MHLDYSVKHDRRNCSISKNLNYVHIESTWASAYSVVAAGAALDAGIGVVAFLRRLSN